jgi:acetylornithine/succinyldiaminopimelate/putrescine aminotransferase
MALVSEDQAGGAGEKPLGGMSPLEQLAELRDYGGPAETVGLSDAVLERFLALDPALSQAITEALAAHRRLRGEWGTALRRDEAGLCVWLQEAYVNFYRPETVNPYVALAARGPWLVTTHGAVLHDSGGYGMLGLGHAPAAVLEAMSAPWVMANIMTPSISHRRLGQRLYAEIGHARPAGAPATFSRFVCMNSGSESVTVAARIADVNALRLTAPGQRHAGKAVYFLSLKGAFHGRTDRPAQASDSSMRTYRQHLASFKERQNLLTVTPNDLDELRAAFAYADANNIFIELMLLEPVMGEGRPGRAITRAFYDEARRLTAAHGSLLLVDSIQAGLRASGTLSMVDYPGFEDCTAPDMETYSKALNAGQYPLSVLALSATAEGLYVKGIYGNTMTTNPRALEVACTVLEQITPALRQNIRERGAELVARLQGLQAEFPGMITAVEGTGLLLCAELSPTIPVVGFDGIETFCRRRGVGVIHGGHNALRFTPHFAITSAELDIIIDVVRDGLRHFQSAA